MFINASNLISAKDDREPIDKLVNDENFENGFRIYKNNLPTKLFHDNINQMNSVNSVIFEYLDNSQKFDILINMFLNSEKKFNIFKTKTELYEYFLDLISSVASNKQDFIKKLIAYVEITGLHKLLTTNQTLSLFEKSVNDLDINLAALFYENIYLDDFIKIFNYIVHKDVYDQKILISVNNPGRLQVEMVEFLLSKNMIPDDWFDELASSASIASGSMNFNLVKFLLDKSFLKITPNDFSRMIFKVKWLRYLLTTSDYQFRVFQLFLTKLNQSDLKIVKEIIEKELTQYRYNLYIRKNLKMLLSCGFNDNK